MIQLSILFLIFADVIIKLIMKYDELENNVVSVTDTETMDLETARQLLHQMVKEVYAKP